MLFYRAAVNLAPSTLNLRRRDHPTPPQGDRVGVAAAEPRSPGPADAGPPAQGRDVSRDRGGFRGVGDYGLAVCAGGRDAVVGSFAEAHTGVAQGQGGRIDPSGPGRHPHPHRPGEGRPAPLLRRTPGARDERAGHRGAGGTILWASGAMPGKTHDLTAARVWGIPRELEKGGILTLADKAYRGAEATVVITPYRGKNKPESQNRPTAPTPSSAAPANKRTPSSRAGASSASCDAAPARPATSSRPSPSYKTTASLRPPEDEMGSMCPDLLICLRAGDPCPAPAHLADCTPVPAHLVSGSARRPGTAAPG